MMSEKPLPFVVPLDGRFEAELPGVTISDFETIFQASWTDIGHYTSFESGRLKIVDKAPELRQAWYETQALNETGRLFSISNRERNLLDITVMHFRRDRLTVEICDPRITNPLLPHAIHWLVQRFDVHESKVDRTMPLSVGLSLAPYVANRVPHPRQSETELDNDDQPLSDELPEAKPKIKSRVLEADKLYRPNSDEWWRYILEFQNTWNESNPRNRITNVHVGNETCTSEGTVKNKRSVLGFSEKRVTKDD